MKCSNLIICGHLNSTKFIPWAIPLTSLELLQGAVEPCAQGSNKCLITQVCLHCVGSRATLMLKKTYSKYHNNFQLFTYLLISEAELKYADLNFTFCMVTNS